MSNLASTSFAVKSGLQSGFFGQGTGAIAIGFGAGATGQGTFAVAAGPLAGFATQGTGAVALGYRAGYTGQGQYSVAIGPNAGSSNLPRNAVVINAASTELNPAASGLYISPINNQSTAMSLIGWDASTKQVQSSTGLLISANGNVGLGTAPESYILTANGSVKMYGSDFIMTASSRGVGGRALVHEAGNALVINYDGDFTGGVRVDSTIYNITQRFYYASATPSVNSPTLATSSTYFVNILTDDTFATNIRASYIIYLPPASNPVILNLNASYVSASVVNSRQVNFVFSDPNATWVKINYLKIT